MAILILVGLAFIVGAAIVLGGYLGATQGPGMMMQRRLEARLQEISQAPEERGRDAKELFKEQKAGPLPALDRLVRGTAKGSAISRWLEQTGVHTTVSAILLIALVSSAAVGLVVAMAVRAPWALPVGAVVGFGLPFMVLNHKRGKRLRTFEEAFPEALDLISRALKAGHAFATGL
jgi:tight adherence protein B